jgi:hypothetical protein
MKRYYQLFSILCILWTCIQNIAAQPDSAVMKLLAFVEKANAFSSYLPQEKVYIHTDNTDYFLGETIWFKAYVVQSDLHKPANLSKVLYVELLSPEGEVVVTKKLEVLNGQSTGEIYLNTRSMYSGFYELRAYTRYMTNFDKESLFSRIIPVYSFPETEGDYSVKKITGSQIKRNQFREKQAKRDDINITFFPEGGNLVQGLISQVAFKATDKEGKSIDVKGIVYNDKKEEKAVFSSLHQGMGVFRFQPGKEEYTAEITAENKKKTVKIPNILPVGYVMTVDNMNESELSIRIDKSPALNDEAIGLAVLVRGKVYSFMAIDFEDKNAVKFPIDKTDFPAGVAQVILFNIRGQLLADRLAFIQKEDAYLYIRSKADKAVYDPFEKVNLEFWVQDAQGNPVATTFSLSVKEDATSLSPVHRNTMLSHLLLSSDVKGMIERPDYYFEAFDRTRCYALDLLLLTQGWRRYQWEKLSGQQPVQLTQKVEKSLVIDGVIKSRIQKAPGQDLDLELIMTQRDSTGYYGDNVLTGFCRTNKAGRFEFLLENPMHGTWETLIQAKKKGKNKDNRIMIDRFSPLPAAYPSIASAFTHPASASLLTVDEPEMQDLSPPEPDSTATYKTYQLQELEVTAKQVNRAQEEKSAASHIVYDVHQQNEKLIDKGDEQYDRVVDFLAATDPAFAITPSRVSLQADPAELVKPDEEFFSDKGYYNYNGHPVMFLLDNKPLFDQAKRSVDNVSMSMIEKVVITTSPSGVPTAIYDKIGDYSAGESVNVRYLENKTGLPPSDFFQGGRLRADIVYIFLHSRYGMKSVRPAKGVRNLLFEGFSVAKEFYSPVYEYEMEPGDKDYRRTLYWNPSVLTGDTGKASVSFYNNSTATGFAISAETITEEGKIARYIE